MRDFLKSLRPHKWNPTGLLPVLGLMGLSFVGSMQAQEPAQPLPLKDFKAATQKLSPKSIPNFTGSLQPNARQSFVIAGKNGASLVMVPVRYDSYTPAADNTAFRCGIFFFDKLDHAPLFVPGFGYDFTETMGCEALLAVGFMPVPGSEYPRLLLIYKGYTTNGDGPSPLVMEYSSAEKRYVPNEKMSTYVYEAPKELTIANMKAELHAMGK